MNMEKPTGLIEDKKKSSPAQRQLTFYELSQQRKKQQNLAKLKKKYGDDYKQDLVVYSKSNKIKKKKNIIYKNLQETDKKDEIEVMDINEEVNDDDTLLDGLSASILEDDIISPVQSKLK